jgi:hypothetical protein
MEDELKQMSRWPSENKASGSRAATLACSWRGVFHLNSECVNGLGAYSVWEAIHLGDGIH